jgi:ATP-dependent protease ClpP protease subunit
MPTRYHGGAVDRGSVEARIVAHNGQRMAVVRFSGPIGRPLGFNASEFIESLNRLGDYDVLYGILDSPGGSAIEAWLIHQFLVRDPARRHGSLVLIATECSGDAILIGLGFQQILMHPQSYICFHPVKLSRPATTQRVTRLIAGLIARRIGCQIENVLGWMDKKKKLTAEECLKLSLCDAII